MSYSPNIHKVDYSLYIDLLCDTRTAARIALTGSHKPVIGNYEYVTDFSHIVAGIEDQYAATGKPVEVCHDTETLGSDPFFTGNLVLPAARFVTWQFSHRPGYSAIKYFDSKDQFYEWLRA